MENVYVDFSKVKGPFKPVNGVGNGPVGSRFNSDRRTEFKNAKIPFSRLHDTEGSMGSGEYVNIHCIFKNFDADENDLKNYNFKSTDQYLKYIMDSGTKVFYRLGETIENNFGGKSGFPLEGMRNYTVVPKDFEKWARICEHIIRHYNEGWADGFRWGIEYFEIWNEPDGIPNWDGTPEQYFRLYSVTANHLRKCFGDSIKIGGYASTGFYEMSEHRKETTALDFADGFLKYISDEKTKAPLDFFSWHFYGYHIDHVQQEINYCRKLLDRYGFHHTLSILDEWNIAYDLNKPEGRMRKTMQGAAFVGAMHATLQKENVDLSMYYDAEIGRRGFCGLFSQGKREPEKPFYQFMIFRYLSDLGNEVFTSENKNGIYTLGASDCSEAMLAITNFETDDTVCRINIKGLKTGDNIWYDLLLLDDEHTLESVRREQMTGNTVILEMKKNTTALIRFNDGLYC